MRQSNPLKIVSTDRHVDSSVDLARVEAYLKWLEEVRRRRTGTVEQYRVVLVQFVRFLPTLFDPPRSWGSVEAHHVEAFITRPRHGGRVPAAATMQKERVVVNQFFVFLVGRGVLDASPMMDVPTVDVPEGERKAIPSEVWRAVWLSTMADDDRLWLGMGYFIGLRRREIVFVGPEMVNVNRETLTGVERKGGTFASGLPYGAMTAAVHRHLPDLCPDPTAFTDLMAMFARDRQGERCLVTCDLPTTEKQRRELSFGDEQLPHPNVLATRLRAVLVGAGLKRDTFTLHALRHSCATNLVDTGMPIHLVSEALGHKNIQTTMGYISTANKMQQWLDKS